MQMKKKLVRLSFCCIRLAGCVQHSMSPVLYLRLHSSRSPAGGSCMYLYRWHLIFHAANQLVTFWHKRLCAHSPMLQCGHSLNDHLDVIDGRVKRCFAKLHRGKFSRWNWVFRHGRIGGSECVGNLRLEAGQILQSHQSKNWFKKKM